jgi:predicted HicB family RNase H-like nuclease
MAKPKKEKPMLKQTIVRLTPELRKRARVAAAQRDISLQALIVEALEAHLREQKR